jgi:hypothetical protein
MRSKPSLDYPYFGVRFTDEDKQNLLATGNLGRVVEAEFAKGVKTPVFISLDPQTNELVSSRADRMLLPDTIKGVRLNDTQKEELRQGRAIHLEGMTSSKGTTFSAALQYNADKRGLSFRFDKPKQSHNIKI